MPRKREVVRREIPPDPKYGDVLVAKFINGIMRRGKKTLAASILYEALEIVRKKTGEDPLPIFHKAVDNVRPLIEVKSRRVGGATYQVPVEVPPHRRTSLAIRWLIAHAKARSEKGMIAKLAGELLDAYNNRGGAVKKREDTHRMAEANKAFAHYRW